MAKRWTTFVACGFVLCWFGAAGTVRAERWYIQPEASVYGFWEDNIRLTTDNKIESPGVIARGDIEAGRITESSEISINSAAVARQYFSERDLNTVDFYFDGTGVSRGERNALELRGQYVLDSTLTSEEGTTGFVQRRDRRNKWLLAPRWIHQLTERARLSAEGSYEEVDYDGNERFGLLDYRYGVAGIGATYSLTERTQLQGQFSYARYDAKDAVNESDTFGLVGGVAHSFSETLNMTLLAGGRRAETTRPAAFGSVDKETSTGGVFTISMDKRFEVGSLKIAANRALEPSGGGELVDTYALSIRWNQPINSRWRWSLESRAYRNAMPSGEKSRQDRKFLTVTPRITYLLDEEWSLVGGYRYRYQKYDFSTEPAEANALFLTLRWAPLIER